MMTRNDLISLIEGSLESDIPFNLYGVDRLADLLLKEMSRANTQGYFRAMKDIQSGEVERINSL